MRAYQIIAMTLLVLAAGFAAAEDIYYHVPLTQLEITDGRLPDEDRAAFIPDFWPTTYARIDGEGEVYIDFEPARRGADRFLNEAAVACRLPARGDITGRIYMKIKIDGNGQLHRFAFRIPADMASPEAEAKFHRARADYYFNLLDREDIAGAAWYRRQYMLSSVKAEALPDRRRTQLWQNRSSAIESESSLALFSGGRAMAENLALDQILRVEDAYVIETEDIGALPGITIQEIDWKPLIQGLEPEMDPLARYIPADQHAFFFPNIQAAIVTLGEARKEGIPVLQILESRAENAHTLERYEDQFCFSVEKLVEALGPALVRSVAMTGSDPYWRTGSDVAVLLESGNPAMLRTVVSGWVSATAANRGLDVALGEIRGVNFVGASSRMRDTSAYVARIGDMVIITNSLAQIDRLAAVNQGEIDSIASLDEYIFFRGRYPRTNNEETGFLILTDEAIRRWCSARWRIGASRRIRAAAFMSDLQAEYQDALLAGEIEERVIAEEMPLPGGGEVWITPGGVYSPVYGSLDFLTPIIELPIDKVTAEEARSYRSWLRRYEARWGQVFDPIAASFAFRPDGIATDVTIMPLSRNSDYRDIAEYFAGREIAMGVGEPHRGAAWHIVASLNRQSELFRFTDNILGQEMRDIASPTAWIGDWAALYLDDTPFLADFAAAEDKEEFLEANLNRIPIALQIHVRNPLQFVAFIAAFRVFIDTAAPDMTRWETLEHAGRRYVRITFAEELDAPEELAVFYAIMPGALTISLNEDVIKNYINRRQADRQADGDDRPAIRWPWTGGHISLMLSRAGLEPFAMDIYREAMQRRSWGNIQILNEWKLRYPGLDPQEVHESVWNVRLLCPGGGEYVWDDQLESMVSTAYGHPFAPRPGPAVMEALRDMNRGDFSLAFENDGLRARALFRRIEEEGNMKE